MLPFFTHVYWDQTCLLSFSINSIDNYRATSTGYMVTHSVALCRYNCNSILSRSLALSPLSHTFF